MSVKGKAQAMSGAGLLVVGTLCIGLLMALATVCYLTIQGIEVPSQLETIVGGLLVGVPALLAKTYRDAQPEPQSEPTPVEVISSPDHPVVTEEVSQGAADALSRRQIAGAASRRSRETPS